MEENEPWVPEFGEAASCGVELSHGSSKTGGDSNDLGGGTMGGARGKPTTCGG
jgi:hypothetical protein